MTYIKYQKEAGECNDLLQTLENVKAHDYNRGMRAIGLSMERNPRMIRTYIIVAYECVIYYYMKNNYRRTKTTVSLINYHFVFCPRYRRKIFSNEKLNNRFKALINKISKENDFKIVALKKAISM